MFCVRRDCKLKAKEKRKTLKETEQKSKEEEKKRKGKPRRNQRKRRKVEQDTQDMEEDNYEDREYCICTKGRYDEAPELFWACEGEQCEVGGYIHKKCCNDPDVENIEEWFCQLCRPLN